MTAAPNCPHCGAAPIFQATATHPVDETERLREALDGVDCITRLRDEMGGKIVLTWLDPKQSWPLFNLLSAVNSGLPSVLSVPVGDDLAKGLRTSQKALDAIARQEQANIAGYLALRDFPVGSASAQFPPDEIGPNALGSDGPSIAAQMREISRISNKYDLRECIEGHDDALGDSYIWRDLMDHCEKLGSKASALPGDAGEGEGRLTLSEYELRNIDELISAHEILGGDHYDTLWNLRNRIKPFVEGDAHFDPEFPGVGEGE